LIPPDLRGDGLHPLRRGRVISISPHFLTSSFFDKKISWDIDNLLASPRHFFALNVLAGIFSFCSSGLNHRYPPLSFFHQPLHLPKFFLFFPFPSDFSSSHTVDYGVLSVSPFRVARMCAFDYPPHPSLCSHGPSLVNTQIAIASFQ